MTAPGERPRARGVGRDRGYAAPVRESIEIVVGGEAMTLLPERGVWWASKRTIVIADVHLGKSQTLRASGAVVPAGVLDETLGRLDRLIRRAGATRVLVVGDFLHAGVGLTPDVIDRVAAWRRGFAGRLVVVPGNHDRALARVAEAWRAEVAPSPLVEGGVAFVHEPAEIDGAFVWAGHVHPAVTLAGGGDRVKLACFVVGARVGVLPAFTRFAAGGSRGISDPAARLVAIAEGHLVEVPRQAPNRHAQVFGL